ncbi:MAG: glycosyltransferase family 2 protein, partial [Clostridia bacterium]|nr:glycosyltransferase family 2 protein [Clostridia bacterium]
ISVCMIVKNEQEVLARCLDCVSQFADEIVVVDTGSNDKTKEIANKFTDKVFDFEWCDDFSKARNYAFSLATCDYVMWLDADDVLEYGEIEKINQLKLNMVADTYMLKYATSFDENGRPSFTFERERILKRDGRAMWHGFVHEAIVPFGKVEHLDITIQHRKIASCYTKRNLDLFRKALKRGVKFNAREQYYYARELFYWGYYKKCKKELNKFFKMPYKFLPNTVDGILIMSKCCEKLNDLNNAKKWLYEGINIVPNAEIICELARIYKQEDNIKSAIYFYESALNVDKSIFQGVFIREEYYYLIPLLELVALYYEICNKYKAKNYHLKLKERYFYNEKVIFNDKFF